MIRNDLVHAGQRADGAGSDAQPRLNRVEIDRRSLEAGSRLVIDSCLDDP